MLGRCSKRRSPLACAHGVTSRRYTLLTLPAMHHLLTVHKLSSHVQVLNMAQVPYRLHSRYTADNLTCLSHTTGERTVENEYYNSFRPPGPETSVTNYQSTLRNIPGE